MSDKAIQYSCVGTGLIVLDVIRGFLGTSISEHRYAGGSCGNILTILSYFGWDSNAIGRIGDDQEGRDLIEDLRLWGVNTNFMEVETGRETPVIVQENFLDAKGRPRHRFLQSCSASGRRLPPYRPLLCSQTDFISGQLSPHSVFFFDRVAPGTLRLAKNSRATGALVVFEPSGIKEEVLFVECLKTAHVVKYANDRVRGIQALIEEAKVPVEIVTFGAKGLGLRLRAAEGFGEWMKLPAFSTLDFVDAAGSGDWTTAGFIHSLMSSGAPLDKILADTQPLINAIRRGQAMASLNCAFEGARGMMYAAESKRILCLANQIVDEDITPGASLLHVS
ncbi:PfkB family carbohydrate kinase [Synechococcus sp. CCAP 1479/9]|uniref:PfkB family carbohydrate kinase n=1 Tax=Synechococcus sp. CCAP 1479/9 TaxID=1221593 RepID=UPI001C24DA9B|nr:PfkB family carbohydrate kinase [Synechococcus sp. CCAP 1479/9]